jgi:hypothetical protein
VGLQPVVGRRLEVGGLVGVGVSVGHTWGSGLGG